MGFVRRGGVGVAVVAAGLVGMGFLFAGSASAHVTVAAPGVSVGQSDALITFRVPDESDSASTVGFKVQLPIDHPLLGILVAPQPGWTATVVNTKLPAPVHTDDGDITEAASEIDWTADAGAGIKPGFFGQFTMIAGSLPEGVSTLTFKAIQAYSDKRVVSWVEVPAAGSTVQPDHPAPTLHLAATTTASPTPAATHPAATTAGASKSAATTGIILGAVGVLLGALALAIVLLRGRTKA